MARAENLWEYTFVHHWGKPDSVSEHDFIIEKEAFEHTFSQKQEIMKEPKRLIWLIKELQIIADRAEVGKSIRIAAEVILSGIL